jgi:hypothetical protein
MANEAVCIVAPTEFTRYTVADAAGIAKGTLLKLSADPNTAAASSAAGDVFAGIAWEEKTANDGVTNIGVALNGTWDLTCGGAGATLGAVLVLSGANLVGNSVEADLVLGRVVGKAMETGSAAEVIRVRVGSVV